MKPWLLLSLAIVAEIIATTSLKLSLGFTRTLPSVVVVVGYGAAFWLESLTMKALPLGLTYAIWSGAGTVGAVIIGALIWQEALTPARLVGMGLIVVGVAVLGIYGKGHGQ
ncbi:MAG: multidrug efflux SMR transporter [Cytophagales bacterium]|nr:multidrug efflux SMR transporter [Armatimonadota bacterium]